MKKLQSVININRLRWMAMKTRVIKQWDEEFGEVKSNNSCQRSIRAQS